MKKEHEIIVGNIGAVYNGTDWEEARKNYNDYCNMASSGYDRAAYEPVYWFIDGDLYEETEY